MSDTEYSDHREEAEREEYTEHSTDDGKRRRETDSHEKVFKKSKKVQRTPPTDPRAHHKNNDLVEIKEMMRNMMSEILEIRKDNKEFRTEMKELRQENMELREEVKNLKEKIGKLEETNIAVEKIDRGTRKNNIIVSGLEIDKMEGNNNPEKIEKFLKQHLDITTKIKQVQKTKNNLLIIGIESFEDKIEIMRNKNKLKQTELSKIYISNDLTPRERQIQKSLKELADKSRQENKVVKMGYQKLIIDGQEWRWNEKTDTLERCQVNRA